MVLLLVVQLGVPTSSTPRRCPKSSCELAISTSHKTGTFLALTMVDRWQRITRRKLCMNYSAHLHNCTSASSARKVSTIVRNLDSMIVSGYIYHLQGPELWTVEPMSDGLRATVQVAVEMRQPGKFEKLLAMPQLSYAQFLNNVTEALGLFVESRRTREVIERMLRETEWVLNHGVDSGLVMRLEEFEEDFEGSVLRFGRFFELDESQARLFLDRMSSQNVYKRRSRASSEHVHLDSSSMIWKSRLLAQLSEAQYAFIHFLSQRLEHLLQRRSRVP